MADGVPVSAQDGVDKGELVRDGADQPVHLTAVQDPHPDVMRAKDFLSLIDEYRVGHLQRCWGRSLVFKVL